MNPKTQLFSLGQTLQTRAISDKSASDLNFAAFVTSSLHKHHSGDWGECGEDDSARNDEALRVGERLFSVYEYQKSELAKPVKIWIITEADRSATTVLFPSEY